jgi:catechol 2,3-dioxygenase-like lactoylglutathione lyase family enzyme
VKIPARISIVTLGVRDVARSAAFYAALGWERCAASQDSICWFRTADSYLGIYGRDALAADAHLPAAPASPFGGITLAINLDSETAVVASLDAAVAAGGTLLKPAVAADWGGFSGYFADPDGHPWEVAFNPFFPIGEDGRIRIP